MYLFIHLIFLHKLLAEDIVTEYWFPSNKIREGDFLTIIFFFRGGGVCTQTKFSFKKFSVNFGNVDKY